MRFITVDIETYSPQDITKVGAYRYAQDPDFQILLLGFALEDTDKVTVLDLTLEPDPRCCLYVSMPWMFDPQVIKRAHNAAFEWWCLSEYMELSWEQRVLWLQQWECSMIHALYCGLPAQLGALGQVLQQPEDALKMKEGKRSSNISASPASPPRPTEAAPATCPATTPPNGICSASTTAWTSSQSGPTTGSWLPGRFPRASCSSGGRMWR